MSQTEIWSQLAIIALNYIFVSAISASNQKQTVTDLKTDLRTAKEDLLSELKDTREALLRENEVSTQATINIIKAEITKEMESAQATIRNGNNNGSTTTSNG